MATAALLSALIPLAHGQSSVTLAWDPSPSGSIAAYRLYWGGASGNYTSMISAGTATTATAANLVAGATYFFAVTAVDVNGLESAFSNEISYKVPPPTDTPTNSGLSFSATSGTISSPFAASNGTISQPTETSITTGGRAVYSFNITKTGNYTVSAMVKAPNDGQNSFYVNIDGEPTDPVMIWDIPICTSLTSCTVTWRGNGGPDAATAQYRPKLFFLAAGTHQLIIRGREAYTTLGTITITLSPAHLGLDSGTGRTANTPGLPPAPFVLHVEGQPGVTYTVLASQDLRTWTSIGKVKVDSTGIGTFTDSTSTTSPARYYRLQETTVTPGAAHLNIQPGSGQTGNTPGSPPAPIVLNVEGRPGVTYAVLASQNLRTWTSIGTVKVNSAGAGVFTDSASPTLPARCYRLQEQ